MAVFYDLRLMSLAVLMLASQLDFASAAVRVFGLNAKGLGGDLIGRPDAYVKITHLTSGTTEPDRKLACDKMATGEDVRDSARHLWWPPEDVYFGEIVASIQIGILCGAKRFCSKLV
ncbi:hypothetical protein DPX16_12836 [Anabarilius grahami]|uniref:Uncharacterized protein n=1 Tax=Anabarilius grahami TaxID=495550 RepID=A0A3N0XD40_ANAGA|nr:hypothetical protein DPX16_12836 [Anabarilius grahami]